MKLEDDPRFATNEPRCDAQSEIEKIFDAAMRKKTRAEWTQVLRAAGVPCGPERDYAEVAQDQELFDRGMLFRLAQGDGTSLQVRMPLEFETTQRATASRRQSCPPDLDRGRPAL